jgi:two-component system response regulator
MNNDVEGVEILLVEDSPADAPLTFRALTNNNFANKLGWVMDEAGALDFLFATGAYAGYNVTAVPDFLSFNTGLH